MDFEGESDLEFIRIRTVEPSPVGPPVRRHPRVVSELARCLKDFDHCPYLDCELSGPHKHFVCPKCGARRFAGKACPKCKKMSQELALNLGRSVSGIFVQLEEGIADA